MACAIRQQGIKSLFFLSLAGSVQAATLGAIIPVTGGVADMAFDSARNRLYTVTTALNRVTVWSFPLRQRIAEITTAAQPLAVAMSPDGRRLYVACFQASALTVIDLTSTIPATVDQVSLPASPEGVAVGADGRVLISTIGSGAGNQSNVLLIYDPAATNSRSLTAVPITPPPPTPPQLPSPSIQRANRSFLQASRDGRRIVGVNIPNATTRVVFVYEVASGTVLRSRAVGGLSNVLSLSPDGTRFMAGLTLFDADTMEVLAQQNLANSPFPIPANTNFNTQTNQGGSAWLPDGSAILSAFNIAPTGAARPNISQLQVSDPDNLLIRDGVQLPENLTGKIVVTPNGQSLYAISESGFLDVPIGQLAQQPLADVQSTAVLLSNDQCGVFSSLRSATAAVRNAGRGSLGATTAQLIGTAAVPGLGGPGGPGGGVVIIPGPGGPIVIQPPGGLPVNPTQPPAGAAATAPVLRPQASGNGTDFNFSFNSANRNLTGSVTHEYAVTSVGAVNIPARIRVFQNNRDSDSRGEIIPIPTGISVNEGLTDLVFDPLRQRVYIANSGLNRVEVFDTRSRRLLTPIKTGQLPRALALSPDNRELLVANSGGEAVSIVDLDQGRIVGRLKYDAIPFNANLPLVTPSLVASTVGGVLVVMNNGSVWEQIGGDLVPRRLETDIFGTATTIPGPRSLAVSPDGEFVLIFSGANGFAYLFSAREDRFIVGRQIFQPAQLTGYVGAVTAGPNGSYFVVNGQLLNSSLTPQSGTTPVPAANRPTAALVQLGTASFARYTLPARGAANQALTDAGRIELVNVNTGLPAGAFATIDTPAIVPAGTQRVAVESRTMAVDPARTTAYVLTASGLSIVPLVTTPLTDRPAPANGGIVSASSYQASFAPNSLISIFGQNLASATASASGTDLPTLLGGACVTLNNLPIPLLLASPGQINALIPGTLAPNTGNQRYPLVIRNVDRQVSSLPQQIAVTRVAPGVLVNPETQQAAVVDAFTGDPVDRQSPGRRDRWLSVFATGLGVNFRRNAAGQPTNELADDVNVYFGDPTIREAEMDVRWAGTVPGFIGLYQINLYVPFYVIRGDAVPVTLQVGGVRSQTSGPLVPRIPIR